MNTQVVLITGALTGVWSRHSSCVCKVRCSHCDLRRRKKEGNKLVVVLRKLGARADVLKGVGSPSTLGAALVLPAN